MSCNSVNASYYEEIRKLNAEYKSIYDESLRLNDAMNSLHTCAKLINNYNLPGQWRSAFTNAQSVLTKHPELYKIKTLLQNKVAYDDPDTYSLQMLWS